MTKYIENVDIILENRDVQIIINVKNIVLRPIFECIMLFI